MKILIVDDDEVLAKTIKAMIAREAHRIKTASDGDEAYFTYLQFRPDIIITDIQMPEKSGFELVREIRIHDPAIKTIGLWVRSRKSGAPGRLSGPDHHGAARGGAVSHGKPGCVSARHGP